MAPSTDSEFVTIVSSDGFEFIIPRSAAYVSETFRVALSSTNFPEGVSGEYVLGDYSGVIVEKICEYLCYNEKHKDQVNVPDMDIPPELCLELLMAADFLNT
ncbi:SKP1 component POZ [Penicillium samsonianum]|uniref:SKP1 component POZ n=1 Tax=Penicillium samsonianum TaxID=1882272 RepID=UPI002547A459|nr:SKP1 component POZ [Penicillium samsonianum]KAJ6118557.1 SKP1 component POZ [Penicillium samsonianum]